MLRVPSGRIREELRQQHASLETMLEDLVRVAGDADPRPLQEAWASFERDQLRHLELEEQTLYPLVESAHPDELRALRAEHDQIRDVVNQLGLCCDLHAVRKSAVERLVQILRAHAEREDATLYRWVEEQAPLDTRRHLFRLVVNTLRPELRAAATKSANAPSGR